MKENFRIDETRGSLMAQSVNSAAGYGDRDYLREQARTARSTEVSADVREYAMGNVVRIVQEYGSADLARLLEQSRNTDA